MKKKRLKQRKLRKKELGKKVKKIDTRCKYKLTKWGFLPFRYEKFYYIILKTNRRMTKMISKLVIKILGG